MFTYTFTYAKHIEINLNKLFLGSLVYPDLKLFLEYQFLPFFRFKIGNKLNTNKCLRREDN